MHLSKHIQVFLRLARRASQLLGISVQTYCGIRIWHSLYTLPKVIVPTYGVHLSNTFRYFYSKLGGALISLQALPTLRVILRFDIPYILYNRFLHLLLVCTSPTLLGISTLSQEGVSTNWSYSPTKGNIRIWHSLYTLPEAIVPTSGVHLSNTFRYFYSYQQVVSSPCSLSSD